MNIAMHHSTRRIILTALVGRPLKTGSANFPWAKGDNTLTNTSALGWNGCQPVSGDALPRTGVMNIWNIDDGISMTGDSLQSNNTRLLSSISLMPHKTA
jgi:hypothetical protein